MNPPSALAGAMGRDRKPFTYTPGGIDLSEIKSERMAQRLMRNAMNQGVPETPTHIVQSPPASSKSAVMPNYNCLPVQVFPTFSLPVNPKTLLRTRSNPDPKEKQLNLTENTKFVESSKSSDLKKVIANSNELPPKCDYNNANNLFYNTPVNYGSSEYTAPVLERNDKNLHDNNTARQLITQDLEVEKSNINNIRPVYFNVAPETPSIKSNYGNNVVTINIPSEEIEQINNKKEEVPVLNIQSKSDDITENVNGHTNAVITLNLPTKKSEAKTEKKVEVVKKTLPDGAIQEVKTTTTKTTIDGRTEITTETETTTFPIDDGEDVEYEVEEEEIEELDEKEENNDNKVIKNGNGKIDEDKGVQEIEKEPRKNICQIITQDEKLESSTKKKVVIVQSEMQNSDEENEEEYDDADEPEEVEVEEVVILKQKTQNTDSVRTQIEESKQTPNDENEKEDDKKINDYNITQNGHVEIKNNGENEEEEIEEEDGSEKCEEDDNIEKEEQESEQLDEEVEEEYEEAEEAEKSEEPEKAEEIEKVEEVAKIEEKSEEPEKAEEIEKVEEVAKIEETEKAQETEKAEEDLKIKIEPEIENCNKIIESKSEAKQTLKTDNDIKAVEDISVKIITEADKVIENNEQNKEGMNLEKQALPSKINITLTEPFVPLDKVEEVEIKPIGPAKEVITKTHTEIITKTTDKPVGTHSTQTEYNIVENIVTVNRTSKTLEHAYEEIPDNVSTIKTILPPPTSDNNFTALSQPTLRSHQPVFEPEPQIERRHSLLLERISMDRQMPSEIYQNNYQNNNQVYEDRQYLQEPQSEILIVSNVKPSTISKNQQWYQQNETDNVSNSNIVPSTDIYSNQQHWQNTQYQYKPQTQSQPFYEPKPHTQSTLQTTYQPQPRVQPSPQPLYQVPPQVQNTPQPIYQPKPQTEPIYRPKPEVNPKSQPIYQTQPQVQPTIQPIYHSHPQYQQNYSDNSSQETYKYSSNNYEQTTNLSYPSKPVWTGKIVDPQSLPNSQSNHSYLQKDSTELFQKSSQQFSSSYVPPPWEQDCNYAVDNSMQSFYQPPPPKTTLTPSTDWKPSKPIPKFTKPTPTAYIPPAPNQSFVKTASTVQPTKQQGRKTYYSEYERRYISVPETTYIPNETKFQPQPDPSPQYFYDNNEPAESVEPQWRKELREFKEQSSKITVHTEQSNVRPPWEEDPKYAAPKDFTSTPTWTQTLKPRSWRERSYEPEYIGSQELPKTNTLGRGRPQSSYVKNSFDRVPDRTRGVSVDRYNPNNYQSPMTREHPPPASHILDPIVQGKTYHNPNVPAYHSRASAEPREQPITYQQPRHRESRATPVQSRSFKYLQWITGTDD